MTEWIYESPDGGKTVTRRPATSHNDKAIYIEHQAWWNLKDLQEISKQLIHDQKLRDRHPALDDLWKQYQTMKSLVADQ